MIERSFENECGSMTSSDDVNAQPVRGDGDDVPLPGVDDAIMAVQNEPNTVTEPQHAEPTDSFPEIDDADDTKSKVEGLLQIGEERSRTGDSKGALTAFNKAIALDPASDMAWFNRGVLLEAQQDARGARQAFQICLDLNDQHAPATANMAILLERIGDLDGAFEMANKALEFYPGHPSLVQLQERCKDSGLSVPIEAMKPSLEVQQDVDMDVVKQIADEAGIDDAEDLLQEAMHHDHDHDESLSVEELQSAAAVVVATQQISQELHESKPEPSSAPVPEPKANDVDLDALSEQAKAWLKEGKAREALQLLKPHLKTIGAQHASAWRIAGGAMARLDLDNHAIAAMSHAQNLEPSHAAGWFNLGSIQQRNDKLSEALQAYKRAMEADADYVKAGEKMASLALEQGWLDHYLDACRTVISATPDHELRAKLIDTLLQLSSGEHEILEHTSGLPPTIPAGPELASEALELLDDTPTAIRAHALSLALQHSDAVLMWKSLIQVNQNDPSHWTGLAKALEMAGDLATASKCHAKASALTAGAVQEPAPEPAISSTPSALPAPAPPLSLEPDQPVLSAPLTASMPTTNPSANHQPILNTDVLLTPREPSAILTTTTAEQPIVDLAKAALDAAQTVARTTPQTTGSSAVANQDIAWFNQGVQLIEDGKYREALSSFDKALPAFAGNDEMIIRILNNRGNAYYFLEQYPKCVESYHQAMTIRPTEVRGETLYNMGTAYAEMERYNDAIKCFEQAIPRGLDNAASKRAKDQIRRCRILQKAMEKKMKRRR